MNDLVRKEYGRGKPIPIEVAEEAIRLYKSGITVPPIGKKLNVGRSAVYKILKDNNVECRSRGYSRDKSIGKENEIIAAYISGLSALETGKKFGIDESGIFNCLRRMNVTSRPIGKHDASKSPNWKGGISKTIEYKREKCRKFTKLYRETNPLFKLSLTLRGRINTAFRCAKLEKNIKAAKSTTDLLGTDFATVMKYLESKFQEGMSWENHGVKRWHIDHIIPLASAKTKEELFSLFHYSNLQPLWAKDNHQKHAKLNWKKPEVDLCL